MGVYCSDRERVAFFLTAISLRRDFDKGVQGDLGILSANVIKETQTRDPR